MPLVGGRTKRTHRHHGGAESGAGTYHRKRRAGASSGAGRKHRVYT